MLDHGRKLVLKMAFEGGVRNRRGLAHFHTLVGVDLKSACCCWPVVFRNFLDTVVLIFFLAPMVLFLFVTTLARFFIAVAAGFFFLFA